jgi:lysine-N-methylase
MSTPPVSPRYMTRFSCIAERCEDTCCAGWRIPMSQAHLRRMEQMAAGTPDAERIEKLIQLNPYPIDPGEYAAFTLKENGECAFLDGERLCSLQRRHGEAILPNPCSTFPRSFTFWGEQLEVAGSLACPEIARLVLLAEDAFESVPAPPEQLNRAETGRHVEPEMAADIQVLRAAVLRLMRRREYPHAVRLALLAWLGARVEASFHALEDLKGEARAEARSRLEAELRRFEAAEVLEPLQREFLAMPVMTPPNASLFKTILNARLEHTRGPVYAQFVSKVLGVYDAGGGGEDGEAAWSAYAQRCEQVERLYGARLEQYFLQHSLNHFTRAVITRKPGTLAAAFRYTLRVAVVRWAFMNHPEVVALCEEALPLEQAQARLDAAAVDSFHLIARHVEQAADFLAIADDLAGAGGEETLNGSLAFAQLCDLGRARGAASASSRTV